MLRQKIVVAIVTLAVISTAGFVVGQESTKDNPQSTSLLGQLDQFGKKLMGGIFPSKSDSTTQRKTTSNSNRYRRASMQKGFKQARAGSPVESEQQTARSQKYSRYKTKPTDSSKQPSKQRVLVARKSNTDNTTTPQRQTVVAAEKSQPRKKDIVADNTGQDRPIHERLMGFSRSAFSSKPKEPASEKKAASKPVGKDDSWAKQTRVSRSMRQPVSKQDTAKIKTLKKTPDNNESDSDVAAALSESLAKPKIAAKQTPARSIAKKNTVMKNAEPKVVANKAAKPKTAKTKALASKTVAPTTNASKKAQPQKAQLKKNQPQKNQTQNASENKVAGNLAAGTSDSGVLFERHSPMLNVRTMGPRHITVDKESTYTVYLDNLGQAEAAEVVVTLELPESADVLGADPSRGATRSLRAANGSRQFEWRLGALAAGGSEKIALRIVPRKSRPIDMGIRWDFKPAASQTVIEVQEPKLEMRLDGPREVAFGK
ncbi:MAG: hypothetical protein U9N87_09545, partial [Planctomycetota bacterium]|nr:hypothetical protein [Planctomycetota bacterium]